MSPDIQTQPENKPENKLTQESLNQSLSVFENDLGLVHPQPGATPRQITDIPLDPFSPEGHHQYSLTTKAEMLDAERLQKTKYVVVGCMDWRVNKAIFDKAKAEGYSDDEILVITVGGGIVQHDAPGQPSRTEAMKNILSYLSQECHNLEKVMVTGHMERCGAVAHWTDGRVIDDETYAMGSMTSTGAAELVPENLKSKTKAFLLKPTVYENEKRVEVEFIEVPIKDDVAMHVSDLIDS